MTVLSKKTVNNNKDSSANQQPQQQQSQQQQPQITPLPRTRLPRDDEHPDSPLNLNEDSNENTNLSSSPTTSSNNSLITTTSPTFSNNSKRKAHYYHQHHHQNHHVHSTISKQPRRRGASIEENPSSNDDNFASSSNSVMNKENFDEDDQNNSEDEYDQTTLKYNRNNLNELELRFERTLKEKKGLVIKPVKEDGACLFRAVSDQVFGDEEMHGIVRQNCMDYIVKNADFFRAYITEDFDHYITRKRRQNCHGNHIEMIALSELYNRPIEVYEYSTEPINIVHGMYKTDNEPIRLSYHCGIHYNSINDPWRPTAGHGLGLPDLEPGHAQQSLIVSALRQSEDNHIEQTMLDDKLAATDWEATQDELIQQIARESYLQWLSDTNQQYKDNKTTLSSNSSETTTDKTVNTTEESSSKNLLPLKLDERTDCEFALPFHYEGDTVSNPVLDDDDEDEDSLMRQVLAMSQIEYVESLRKQQEEDQPSKPDDPNQPSSSDTQIL